MRERASYAFATASVALVARVDGASVAIERLAFGGLAAKPWRVEAAERRGSGTPEEIARDAAAIILEGARATDRNRYKIALAQRTLHAALIDATGAKLMTRLDRQNAETRVIGRSINRLDGPQKVTGSATYAYERAKMRCRRSSACLRLRRSVKAKFEHLIRRLPRLCPACGW